MLRYASVRARLEAFEAPRVVIGGGVGESEIHQVEQVLTIRIPDEFRDYFREFGWLEVGSEEIFGLGADIPSHLNLVDVTRDERDNLHPLTPHHLLPVLNNGLGDICCIDCGPEGGGRMVWWNHDGPSEQLGQGFEKWLIELIEESLPPI